MTIEIMEIVEIISLWDRDLLHLILGSWRFRLECRDLFKTKLHNKTHEQMKFYWNNKQSTAT